MLVLTMVLVLIPVLDGAGADVQRSAEEPCRRGLLAVLAVSAALTP